MNLRLLSLAQMVQISEPWVSAGPVRTAIEAVPLLAGALPFVTQAHKALYACQTATRAAEAETAKYTALVAEAATCDADHDRAVRALFYVLTGLAAANDDDTYLELRDWALPQGLKHAAVNFEQEAGHGALLASGLGAEPQRKAALKAIATGSHTLLFVAETLIKNAKRLGEIEREKAALTGPSAAGHEYAARTTWAQVVRQFQAAAEMAALDDGAQALIFSHLRAVEAAHRTKKSKKAAPTEPTAPEAKPE